MFLMQLISLWVCRRFGCSRDWPQMETCSRCGKHLPLDEEPEA